MLANVLADNRRRAYRVRPISTDKLTLALVHGEERHVPYEIADVTCSGASVRFIRGGAPSVEKGEALLVAIDSPNLERNATVSAKVVFSCDTDEDSLIGVAFDSPQELAGQINESFLELFNRRSAYRDVEPNASTALAVAVMPLQSASNSQLLYPVNVRNISATGICLDVSREPDDFMRESENIRLALRLPGQRSPNNIVTKVCYRTVNEGGVFYGCRFDWSQTPNAETILEDLTEYTLDRFDYSLESASA